MLRRRARPRLRPVLRHDLVRDGHSRISRKRSTSPRACTSSFPASCWPTTARRRSTGRRSSTTPRSRKFQRELGAMGYKFQFITLAGFHALNYSMFQLARGYKESQMTRVRRSCSRRVRRRGVATPPTKHQREVGAGYFDDVTQTVTAGTVVDCRRCKGSTEEAPVHQEPELFRTTRGGGRPRLRVGCGAAGSRRSHEVRAHRRANGREEDHDQQGRLDLGARPCRSFLSSRVTASAST